MIEPRIKIPEITNEARQRIRNNSVAKLPANASESGLTAIALQELFVAPIIGEQNSIITEYNEAITEMNVALNVFDGEVTKASEDSAAAKRDSSAALTAALRADENAEQSQTNSSSALEQSTESLTKSITAEANSITAKSDSKKAVNDSANALSVANGIDGKATQALGKSALAETNSVNAVNTANTVRSEFDQIVEGKIGISQDILSTDPLTAPSSEAVRNALDDLTQVITPISQQSQVVHLEGTSAGFVDELIMSSEPRQVVSPNLFSGMFRQGHYNETGIFFGGSNSYISNLQTIQIKANRQYKITTNPIGFFPQAYFYDSSMQFISANYTFLSPVNASFMNFMVYKETLQTIAPNYFANVMLNEGSTALPYQPYTGQPSPDNPIPINVVSSPINIVSCGANLVNVLNVEYIATEYNAERVVIDLKSFHNIPLREDTITLTCFSNVPISLYIYNGLVNEGGAVSLYNHVIAKGNGIRYEDSTITERFFSKIIIPKGYEYFALCNSAITEPSKNFPVGSLTYIRNVMVNLGMEALPYEPYNANTTQIPLETVATETTPSKPVELLGEYNTKTNVLAQKYEKVVFDGSPDEAWAEYISPGQDNLRLTTYSIANKVKDTGTSIVANILSNQYIPKAVIDTYNNIQGIAIGGTVLHIKDYRYSQLGSLTAFKNWLSTNPLTVYYELATPEIITLNPTPPIPTLEGTTNIYAVNNASPVTFNITELLDGGNQTNVVLKDKDDNVLNPRTVAEQVRINDDGETLDRELERIQAAMAGVDSDLSAEISARTAADTQIRDDLINGTLIVKKATDAVLAENANFAITQPQAQNDTTIATTEFVRQAISDVKNIEEGSITLAAGLTASTNFVRRQVNFVYGEVNFDGDITIPSKGKKVGTIPQGFRPNSGIFTSCADGYCCIERAEGNDYSSGISVNMDENGDISLSTIGAYPVVPVTGYVSKINFAYEIL